MVTRLHARQALRVLQIHDPGDLGEPAAVWGSIPVVICVRKDLDSLYIDICVYIYIFTYLYIYIYKAECADDESFVWTLAFFEEYNYAQHVASFEENEWSSYLNALVLVVYERCEECILSCVHVGVSFVTRDNSF